MIHTLIEIGLVVIAAAVIVALLYEVYSRETSIEEWYDGFEDDMAVLHTKVEPVIKAVDPIALAVQDNAGNVAKAVVTAVSDAPAAAAAAAPVQVQTADVAGAQPAAAPVQVQ